jgi:AraC-like DNA-binding protein
MLGYVGAPHIRFYRPVERLRPYVSSYYVLDIQSDGAVEDLLHPEWANIRFILRGHWTARLAGAERSSADTPAMLFGPSSRTTRISGVAPTRTANVGLLPLGWAHLIGRRAHRSADRIASLHDVFPEDTDRLLAALRDAADDDALRRLLDEFLLGLDARRPEPPALLVHAHAVLLDPAVRTAEEFAARLGVSGRHAARLSLDMFGFPPKILLRRQRFLRTFDMMRSRLDEPWARLLDEAYYDQSHFVRDFHRFMGMSPTQYFALPRVLLDPAARLRGQAIGQTLQGLHPAVGKRRD